MNLSVEYSHIGILLVSVREQSTRAGKGAFDEPFHVRLGLEQFQITVVKKTYVEIIRLFIQHCMVVVERVELDVLGDTSNPNSVNNSLGAKSEDVCGSMFDIGSDVSILSFLSSLCFLCFVLSVLGMSSTIFCKELIGE